MRQRKGGVPAGMPGPEDMAAVIKEGFENPEIRSKMSRQMQEKVHHMGVRPSPDPRPLPRWHRGKEGWLQACQGKAE